MACYVIYDRDRRPSGFICGELGAHCADCGSGADNLCDYPVGANRTCDRHICDHHSHEVAPEVHYCDGHYREWQAFRDAGGVSKHLENVIAFKPEK